MWRETMAINGIICVGVLQNWTTHLIGHELTTVFGIDHGQTLAIISPYVLDNFRDQKRVKLLQFADWEWGITSGSDDEKIDHTIEKTRDFFESLGINTHLSEYGVNPDNFKDIVIQLEAHGLTALSETGKIILEVSEKILLNAL